MSESDYNAVEAVMREMIVEAADRLQISPHALTAKIERLLEEELLGAGPTPSSEVESPDPLEVTWLTALRSQAPEAPEDDLVAIVEDLFERLVDAVQGTLTRQSLH